VKIVLGLVLFTLILFSIFCVLYVLVNLDVYGEYMRNTRDKYGYIKNRDHAGFLTYKTAYQCLIPSKSEVKWWGIMYQLCYRFLGESQESRLDYEKLNREYSKKDTEMDGLNRSWEA